jgi:transcriptional regulator with GAF, ATPase, and Fis domain
MADVRSSGETLRRGRTDSAGAILADAMAAASALETEVTANAVCDRLCKALVFVVGATACQASRVQGEFVVDANEHALREVHLGDGVAYRLSDFPLTEEVLREREPRALSFADATVEPSEAFVLRDLGMNALLMLPLYVRGAPWGLVELYEMRMRRFTEDDIAVATFLTAQAEKRLEIVAGVDDAPIARRVYELPDGTTRSRFPRTR